MKAHELARLLLQGKDLDVVHIWDGAGRTDINHVWETKGGRIATSDNLEMVYYDDDRPLDAPNEEEEKYWKSPGRPDHGTV